MRVALLFPPVVPPSYLHLPTLHTHTIHCITTAYLVALLKSLLHLHTTPRFLLVIPIWSNTHDVIQEEIPPPIGNSHLGVGKTNLLHMRICICL